MKEGKKAERDGSSVSYDEIVDALKSKRSIQLRISSGFDEETGEERFITVRAEYLEEEPAPQETREAARQYFGGRRLKQDKKRLLEDETTDLLDGLGVPAHISGYAYLRDAIVMSVLDRQNLGSVTKILYPDIAVKYKATASKVERGIRNAIGKAFSGRDNSEVLSLFGPILENRKRPTNSEFIALVADRLRIKYERYEAEAS